MNYGYVIVVAAPSAFKVVAPLGTFKSIIENLDADTRMIRMEMNVLSLLFLEQRARFWQRKCLGMMLMDYSMEPGAVSRQIDAISWNRTQSSLEVPMLIL